VSRVGEEDKPRIKNNPKRRARIAMSRTLVNTFSKVKGSVESLDTVCSDPA
jgi:hypothetical protein